MKNKFFDLIYRKFVFFYQNKIIEKNSLDSDTNSRIYVFHNVSNEKTNISKFNSNVKYFEDFIQIQLESYKPVEIKNILKSEEKSFAISFDDVYLNVYKYAIPILRKYKIPYTIFIANCNLDKKNYLSKKELIELSNDELCTIGAHSLNHNILRFDKNSYQEINKSKIELEKIINKKIELFAYPYGSIYACSKKNRKEVKKSGYKYGYSTLKQTINHKTKKKIYFLPRINGDLLVKEVEKRNYDKTSNSSSRI